MKAFNTSPRTGWTRATGSVGPEVMQELSRLSRENADLRSLLSAAQHAEVSDRRAHLQSRIETLKAIKTVLFLREKGKSEWTIPVETTLFDIFEDLAPEMMVEISVAKASTYLALMNKPTDELVLSTTAPIPTNQVGLLLADLASLDLVEPSKKKHPVSDKDLYWSLTQEGIDLLKLRRASGLEAQAAKAAASSRIEMRTEGGALPARNKGSG
mgnify:CR=1 FL=1